MTTNTQSSRPMVEFLRAPVAAKTWKDAGYLLVTAAIAVVGIAYLYLGFGAGILFAITLVGIPLLAAVIVGARGFGHVHRILSRHLLGLDCPAPGPFRPGPGVWGFIRAGVTDREGWRAVLFMVVKFALAWVAVFGALFFAAVAAFFAISPILQWVFDPVNVDSDGVSRHSLIQFGDYYFDTWPKLAGLSIVGIVGLFIAPWPIRGLAQVDRWLVRSLLGPSPRSERERTLERGRATAVEDSAARLKQVERDLHDGTQARLVSMAMSLGRAEERLAAGQDPSDLVRSAHSTAKDALGELRELVRGIHPPVLDLGLGPALETLAARSAIPVRLDVQIGERPSPGTETIAYFSVAELLTNAARHSGADRVHVSATSGDHRLTVVVHDNGAGGAWIGGGTGLTGLQSRAETVDGTLTVESPRGGPTVVTVSLPVDGKA